MWNFLSVVVVALITAWVTQRIIAARERHKKISDIQMDLYLATVGALSRMYKAALEDRSKVEVNEVAREGIEVASRLSIYGTSDVMEAFTAFADYVYEVIAGNEKCDEKRLRSLLSEVTFQMCCDVHKEDRCSAGGEERCTGVTATRAPSHEVTG
jgi:hypothetical protein